MKVPIRDIQLLFTLGSVGGLSDGQLLERFAVRHDEAAFEALVRRHGPMVWGVCRRVLRNHHDAECLPSDFPRPRPQGCIGRSQEDGANWLYAVAYKTAIRAEALASRRRAREH